MLLLPPKSYQKIFVLHFDDRNIFKKFTISTTEYELVRENVKDVLLKFNGNMDEFHSQFRKFSLPSTRLFSTLSTQLSALLCSEVLCLCLGKLVNGSESEKKEDIKKELSEKGKKLHPIFGWLLFPDHLFKITQKETNFVN